MRDINYWLGRKYDLMQQQADTQRLGMVADANLTNVKAGLLPAESKAQIGLMGSQGRLAEANATQSLAQARNIDETTKFVGPLARSSIGLNSAQARNINAEATGTENLVRMRPWRFGTILGNDPIRERLGL